MLTFSKEDKLIVVSLSGTGQFCFCRINYQTYLFQVRIIGSRHNHYFKQDWVKHDVFISRTTVGMFFIYIHTTLQVFSDIDAMCTCAIINLFSRMVVGDHIEIRNGANSLLSCRRFRSFFLFLEVWGTSSTKNHKMPAQVFRCNSHKTKGSVPLNTP